MRASFDCFFNFTSNRLDDKVALVIFNQGKHWWFSGRILACHAGGPGSIPGQCNFLNTTILFRLPLIAIRLSPLLIYIKLFHSIVVKFFSSW